MASPIEFDRDLRRHFLKRLVHFLRRVGQAARVDIDANPAAGTLHVSTRLQPANALFKVVTAARALKFDHVGIDVRHQCFFVLPADLSTAGVLPGRLAHSRTRTDQREIILWNSAAHSPTRNDQPWDHYGTASLVKPRVAQANQRD
jgi:hypothetical protein